MQTNFNLPVEMVREIHLRAQDQQRDPQELVVELVASGLASKRPVAKTLPTIHARPLSDNSGLTPIAANAWSDWLKAEETRSEVERYEKAFGY